MARKTVEIFGVVDEMGGGGAAGSPYYRDVQFSKWREVGGEICDTPLYVREPCGESDIRPWMKSIRPGSMLHMEVRFTKQYVEEQLRGKVIRYFGKTRADRQLLEAAKDKRPSTIEVPGFARFTLNSRHNCYATTVPVGRSKVELTISSDRKRTIDSLSRRVQEQGLLTRDVLAQWLDVLERDLLPLKNGEWLDDDEKPVSRATFRRSLKLTAVEVAANGAYDGIFQDGGLFGGHDLVVRGTLKTGPQQADLYG